MRVLAASKTLTRETLVVRQAHHEFRFHRKCPGSRGTWRLNHAPRNPFNLVLSLSKDGPTP